jgi:NDP-sugar pyrophosphorylase family protein
MKAVVLAGGRGTRLAPYTAVFPKPLMPLGDHPILEVILCQLRSCGFTDVWLAVGHLSHLLEAYFGDGRRVGLNIRYSQETQPLGTAGPLTLIPGLDEPFLVMNGDVLTDLDYGDMYRSHIGSNAAVTIGLYSKEVKIDLGVLEVNSDVEIVNYVEKPTFTYSVSMGVYVISPGVVDLLPRNMRFDLPDMIHLLLDRGERVQGYLCQGQWLDIGRPDDYARAIQIYAAEGTSPCETFTMPASLRAAVSVAAAA